MFRFVKQNKAKCLRCQDILISSPEEAGKDVTCSCGCLTISGGATALVRNGKQGRDYEELSTLNFNGECPKINEDTDDPPPEQEVMLKKLNQHLKRIGK